MAEPDWLEALRRNSGLSLTRDGEWMYGGRPVENARVQAMFHGGVAVRDDGEVTLRVGTMWAYVQTDGPALFARAVTGGEGRAATLVLLGEREAPLSSVSVGGWGPDDRLYLWVRGLGAHELPVVCLRGAHQALTAHIEEREHGHVIAIDDRDIPLVALGGIPTAGARSPAFEREEELPGDAPHSEA